MPFPVIRALVVLCVIVAVGMTSLPNGQLAPRIASAAIPDAPVPTFWVTNGGVNAIVMTGSTVYIGGSFTVVGPPTGNGDS